VEGAGRCRSGKIDRKDHSDTESYGKNCQHCAHRFLQQRTKHQAIKEE
jgi:hypothetical protein